MFELTKWTGGDVARVDENKKRGAQLEKRVEQMLEFISEEMPPAPEPKAERTIRNNAGYGRTVGARDRPQIIAAPRICSIRGEAFVAYYEFIDGLYRHTNTGILTAQVCRVSFTREGAGVELSDGHESEQCPFCGVAGKPIYCNDCRNWMCPGRVHGNYFRCRPGCPGEGEVVTGGPRDRGRTPNGWSAGR